MTSELRGRGRPQEQVRSRRGRRTSSADSAARRSRRTGRERPADRRSRDGARLRARAGRPTRRRYLVRRWTALAVLVGLFGTVYLIWFTSLFGVRSVQVSGTSSVSAADVVAAAAIEPGTPMIRVDTVEVRDRVASIPRIFAVEVYRSLPGTVRIVVTERAPVAKLTRPDGVHLVDGTGQDYAVVGQAPAGIPELALPSVAPDDPATRAVVTVLAAVPPPVRGKVLTVTAATPGDVRLTLTGGRTVQWGGAEESERKGAVLVPLLTRPGTVYDVTTPDFPTVTENAE